ncbi:MAG: uracil phosphoribosyltransferase [Planctomycetota bacterium]
MSQSDGSVRVVDHPLLQHHLGQLRSESTTPAEFRALVRRVAMLLGAAATESLSTSEATVATPVAEACVQRLNQRIGLVPILRAGLGLVDPLIELIPTAEVWHLGLFRDEATAQPVEYYRKLPETDPVDIALVVDPMLATGGSATLALDVLRQWGVEVVKLVVLIAAPEGIAAVQEQFPDVEIITGAIDERLNEQKYIVPGLGDAGDRLFNTLR